MAETAHLCIVALNNLAISPPPQPSTGPAHLNQLAELALTSFKKKLASAVSRSDQLLVNLSTKTETAKLAEAKSKALAAETDRLRNKVLSKDQIISEMEKSMAKMESCAVQPKPELLDNCKIEVAEGCIKTEDGAAELADQLVKDAGRLESRQADAEKELAGKQIILMRKINELESRNKMLQNELTRRDVQMIVRGDVENQEDQANGQLAAESCAPAAAERAEAVAREDALYEAYKAKLAKVSNEKDKVQCYLVNLNKRFDEFFSAASAKIDALKKQTREVCDRYSKAVDRVSGLSSKVLEFFFCFLQKRG